MPNAMTDRIVADAKSLPELVAKAQVLDPDLAKALTAKALVASKSTWGPLVGAAVVQLVTRWGLGWDEGTCDLVTGGIILVVSAGLRWVTSSPIGGVFRNKSSQ